jgi:putative salt-induced outer membrane protein YdiY
MFVRAKGSAVIALAVILAAHPALADEVLFNNGDRVSGKIVKVEGGKITIDSKLLGEVTADMKEVKTFSTDQPIVLRTKDGQKTTVRAAAGDAGKVRVEPAAGSAGGVVPLSDIKYVNFREDWTGSIVAGAMFARGNTFQDNANVSFDVTRRTEQDRWIFTGGYNFGRQRDPDDGSKRTTTDNWYATGEYDYFLTERFFVFGSLRYEHDRIADLDIRLVPSVGIGYQWIDTPDTKFDTRIGPAYVYEKFQDGDTNESFSAVLAYHFKKNLYGEKVSLFHDLEYYPSLEDFGDFLVVTDFGLRASLTAKMFAEYKLEYRYDAEPAEDADKNDLRHLVGVGWKF